MKSPLQQGDDPRVVMRHDETSKFEVETWNGKFEINFCEQCVLAQGWLVSHVNHQRLRCWTRMHMCERAVEVFLCIQVTLNPVPCKQSEVRLICTLATPDLPL
jgi:hypothetical protein